MIQRIFLATLILPALAILAGRPARAQGMGGVDGVSAVGELKSPTGDIGVRLSESAVLHAGVTTEVGYDTNVFYNDTARVSSAIMRVLSSLEINNHARDGSASSSVSYSLGASLTYREYLNDDSNVKAQRAFNPSVGGALALAPSSKFSFGLSDSFTRTEEPPFGPGTGTITRSYNLGVAQMRLAPGGGRIATLLRYTNTLDYYENQELQYASNMGHDLMLDLSWKWLPKTALYLQGGVGWVGYIDDLRVTQGRTDSFTYRVLAGVRGLITPKLAISLGAGYSDASYDGSVGGPSGADSISGAVELSYRLGALTQFGLGYGHTFRNSPIVGTFYNVDSVYAGMNQLIASRLAIGLRGRYEYRRYDGIQSGGMTIERTDNVLTVGAQMDYFIKRWFYAGVVYALTFNSSTETPATATVTGVDYAKHQILGRVGVLY